MLCQKYKYSSMGRNHHYWSIIGDPLSLENHMHVSLETLIFAMETTSFLLETLIFSLEIPNFRWRPPDFLHWRSHFFVVDTHILVWRPSYFNSRPPDFHCRPHNFVSDENLGGLQLNSGSLNWKSGAKWKWKCGL